MYCTMYMFCCARLHACCKFICATHCWSISTKFKIVTAPKRTYIWVNIASSSFFIPNGISCVCADADIAPKRRIPVPEGKDALLCSAILSSRAWTLAMNWAFRRGFAENFDETAARMEAWALTSVTPTSSMRSWASRIASIAEQFPWCKYLSRLTFASNSWIEHHPEPPEVAEMTSALVAKPTDLPGKDMLLFGRGQSVDIKMNESCAAEFLAPFEERRCGLPRAHQQRCSPGASWDGKHTICVTRQTLQPVDVEVGHNLFVSWGWSYSLVRFTSRFKYSECVQSVCACVDRGRKRKGGPHPPSRNVVTTLCQLCSTFGGILVTTCRLSDNGKACKVQKTGTFAGLKWSLDVFILLPASSSKPQSQVER